MGRASLSEATKPLFFVLYASVMLSVAEARDKTVRYILTKVINVFLAIAVSGFVCCLILLHIFFLVFRLESPYQTTYSISAVLLFLGFRWGCQKSFRSFFVEFETYQQKHRLDDTGYRFVRGIGILSVVSFVGTLIGNFNTAFRFVQPQCYSIGSPAVVTKVFCHPLVIGLSWCLIQAPLSGQFCLYVTVWRILKTEANTIVRAVSELDKTAENAPEVIERIRLRHADLCCLVSRANQFLTPLFAVIFVSGIGCMLLIVSNFVSDPYIWRQHSIQDLVHQFISIMLDLIVVTLTGANLHLKMHEPVDHLFQLDVLRMSGKESEVVSMFISRLQGAPIAFDILRVVHVDPSIITMLCGTLLTYTIVIIQFETPTVSCSTGALQQLILQFLGQHNASPGDLGTVNFTSAVPVINFTSAVPVINETTSAP